MKDLVDGIGHNLYAPENSITKQEMACMLYKTLIQLKKAPQNVKDNSSGLTKYTDVNDMASWAEEAMTQLVESGIIQSEAHQLKPTETVNREQMAVVLYNLLIQ
ncbi:S-layer homology domain-containing protein [Fusibacter sp. 3D3]|uniref:S-layer homology domain-containing protein n=1 Tax=Fusibacter sp. 3D3 TaxID=1048380 RepID=UPI001586752B|nr:S-layer homology domain-containing protein [Fusibacter sp. 3D3]